MRWLPYVLILIGCNPVKKVLRDPVKIDKVVSNWLLTHPITSDTLIEYLPGEDRIDTVIVTNYVKGSDSIISDTIIKRITRLRTDTVRISVKDHALEEKLQKDLLFSRLQYAEAVSENTVLRKQLDTEDDPVVLFKRLMRAIVRTWYFWLIIVTAILIFLRKRLW